MRHLIDPADFTLEETLSLMDLAFLMKHSGLKTN